MPVDVEALLAPDAGPALGRRRTEVLDLLRATGSPVPPNTARFHLDALVDVGLVTRASQPRAVPGRPSMAYQAVEGGDATGQRHYRLLAEMLTSLIAGTLAEPARLPRRSAGNGAATSPSSPPLTSG
jgi:hypothetical protein